MTPHWHPAPWRCPHTTTHACDACAPIKEDQR